MTKPRSPPPADDPTPPETTPEPNSGTGEAVAAERALLSAAEIAFLLGRESEPTEKARAKTLRAERNIRSNARRTDRRQTDPAYADHTRTLERDRQRRRRIKAQAQRSPPTTEPPAPLPPLSPQEAANRLADYLRNTDTPKTRQLRRRPDLTPRYEAGFAVYRLLSANNERPTRGAMAEALRSRFGLTLTLSQIQKLRDQIEDFAGPGGPWQA